MITSTLNFLSTDGIFLLLAVAAWLYSAVYKKISNDDGDIDTDNWP